ncbi:MAG: hypothetical protein H0V70_18470 [Ktedonobacteraceae bacterium]|nr:hypothetical protein [Ktedonobacteraceae bacterium]
MTFQRNRFTFMLIFLLAALASTGGILFPALSVPAYAASTKTPAITLSSHTVHPGQQLTITVQGLTPQAPFQLLLGAAKDTVASYIWSDSNGTLTNTFTFPTNYITQGTYTLYLYSEDDSSVSIAQTVIKVVPTVFQVTGNSGLPVTITGAGFNTNEIVEVYFGTKTSGTDEGTTQSDSYGSISFLFTIPSGLAVGTYPVTFVRTLQTPATITGKITLYLLTISTPSSARDEQTAIVKGTGFAANEYVTLTWNANGGQQLYADQTDNKGSFTFNVFLQLAPYGSYTLTATGNTSGLSVSTSLRVEPEISLFDSNHNVSGQGNPGEQIKVHGGGFNANERVNIYFQTPKNGITTFTTDNFGTIDTTITMPLSYISTTTYYVYAKNATGSTHARAKFTYITPSTTFFRRYNPDTSAGTLYVDGFGTNETIQVFDHYKQANQVKIVTLTTDAGGSAVTVITWPSSPHSNPVTFAAIGQTTKLIATNTHTVDPTLVTTTTDQLNANGNAGDIVPFQGKDFAAKEKIHITFNDKVVFTVTSNGDGSFTAPVVIPPLSTVSAGAGNIQVKAIGVTSGLVAGQSPYLVTFYYQPTLTLTPASGPSGTTITVTGAHFSAGANIPIGWDGPFTPDPGLSGYPAGTYAVTDADHNGNFTLTIQADGLVSGQTYHVTASNFSNVSAPSATATFVAQ